MSEPHSNQHHHDQGQPVHRITEAQESHTVEQHSRVLKYTISMSVRLACFIAAFFVHGWLQWTFLAAAIVLPYIAVVIANGGADVTKRQPRAEFFAGDDPRLLTSGSPDGAHPAPADGTGQAKGPAAPGTQHAEGEVFTVNEDGETATAEDTDAEAQPGDGTATGPGATYANDFAERFPADAPTTIDGSFVEEPSAPAAPAHGHRRRGGGR